ncbi:hypothetical protein [Pseudoxanthomonas sp. LARHCG66]
MKIARVILLACLVWVLAACGSGMHGTYEDAMGLSQLRFERDGTVVQSATLGGVEVRLRYEVDKDRVRLSHPDVDGAALVLTRVDENTLSGPLGVTYKRLAD